jgi:hypothetical protein
VLVPDITVFPTFAGPVATTTAPAVGALGFFVEILDTLIAMSYPFRRFMRLLSACAPSFAVTGLPGWLAL